MILRSKNAKETGKIAKNLAIKILKSKPSRHAIIVALEGELGAGKTTFVKGFAKALGIKSHITSPTFVILKSYKLKSQSHKLLIHIDAYRLKNYRDLIPLGIHEIIIDPTNIVLIEWSERVKPILPSKYIKVHIDHVAKNQRKIIIN